MKALLIASTKGKSAKVIDSGLVSALNKKLRNLTEFPEGVDMIQLWDKHKGVKRSVNLAQLKTRAERAKVLGEASKKAKEDAAKKAKSDKAKAGRAEKAKAE